MKQKNDVDILFDAIDEDSNKYQEIVGQQENLKSISRWPLIAAINEVTPIENTSTELASEVIKDIKISVSGTKQVLTERTLITKTQIEKVREKDIKHESVMPQKVVVQKTYEMPSSKTLVKTILNEPFLLQDQANVLVVDTSHIKPASSESISSIFERLKSS